MLAAQTLRAKCCAEPHRAALSQGWDGAHRQHEHTHTHVHRENSWKASGKPLLTISIIKNYIIYGNEERASSDAQAQLGPASHTARRCLLPCRPRQPQSPAAPGCHESAARSRLPQGLRLSRRAKTASPHGRGPLLVEEPGLAPALPSARPWPQFPPPPSLTRTPPAATRASPSWRRRAGREGKARPGRAGSARESFRPRRVTVATAGPGGGLRPSGCEAAWSAGSSSAGFLENTQNET